MDLLVSETDVSEMRGLDAQPLEQASWELPDETQSTAVPPLMILLDCVVNKDNFVLAKQALVQHANVDLKVSHLTLSELGRIKIASILSLIEVGLLPKIDYLIK